MRGAIVRKGCGHSSHTGRRINEEEKTRGKHFSNITPPPILVPHKKQKTLHDAKVFFLDFKNPFHLRQVSTYNYLDYVLLLPPSTLHHILRCFYS
jgi:hypothetical protein